MADTGGKPLTLAEALSMAVGHHRAGRFSEAEALYRRILAARPDEPNALHLLGVLASQTARPDVAIEMIAKAIAVKADFPEAHVNLGNVLKAAGRIAEAEASYRRAVSLKPEMFEALYGLGLTLKDILFSMHVWAEKHGHKVSR